MQVITMKNHQTKNFNVEQEGNKLQNYLHILLMWNTELFIIGLQDDGMWEK